MQTQDQIGTYSGSIELLFGMQMQINSRDATGRILSCEIWAEPKAGYQIGDLVRFPAHAITIH